MSRKPKITQGADDVTTTSQTVAAGQLRAFVDRILRLREEQDTIGDDVKEVYAELKGVGFDRTAVGALVTELRRKAKDGEAAMLERNAILDLYRTAYDAAAAKPSHTHAYARTRGEGKKPDLKVVGKPADGGADIMMKHTNIASDLPPHDAETGEIFEQPETAQPASMVVDGDSAEGDGPFQASLSTFHPEDSQEGESDGSNLPSSAAIPSQTQADDAVPSGDQSTATIPEAKASEDNGGTSAIEGAPMTGEASRLSVGGGTDATNSEIKPDPSLSGAHDGEPKPSPAPSSAKSEGANSLVGQVGEEPGSHVGSNAGQAVTKTSDADVPAFLKVGLAKSIAALRPHCLNPSECAGYGRVHCHKCTTAMEAKS
ncbi:DUF2312 domain-containing protein [Mesorhizobium onobrychidis]|uniref:DUF2312 domain-containing protein n=1 Tax=Mesorhizobium onobrychidis TaxID=2775404 RepID=A0ABY5QU60_9HYPH|nr:DUF2312 domain-containing protein [Mesorhizobium onobrychidis]UVC14735.1 DUF2312 domain-containing protein [Mesorhizobium onobrychidis]